MIHNVHDNHQVLFFFPPKPQVHKYIYPKKTETKLNLLLRVYCFLQVTWVEHVEVDDRALAVHIIYKLLVDSGLAFGARRWVASLDRQCERIASTLATNIPQGKLSGILFISSSIGV